MHGQRVKNDRNENGNPMIAEEIKKWRIEKRVSRSPGKSRKQKSTKILIKKILNYL